MHSRWFKRQILADNKSWICEDVSQEDAFKNHVFVISFSKQKNTFRISIRKEIESFSINIFYFFCLQFPISKYHPSNQHYEAFLSLNKSRSNLYFHNHKFYSTNFLNTHTSFFKHLHILLPMYILEQVTSFSISIKKKIIASSLNTL